MGWRAARSSKTGYVRRGRTCLAGRSRLPARDCPGSRLRTGASALGWGTSGLVGLAPWARDAQRGVEEPVGLLGSDGPTGQLQTAWGRQRKGPAQAATGCSRPCGPSDWGLWAGAWRALLRRHSAEKADASWADSPPMGAGVQAGLRTSNGAHRSGMCLLARGASRRMLRVFTNPQRVSPEARN